MKIEINHYPTYSEAVLTEVPANFDNAAQEELIDTLNVDILVF